MSLDKIKIEKTAKELIGHLDPNAKLQLETDETNYRLNVETEISGLLIGRKGETLEALQHVLRLILAKENEEFVPVILDIAGYRSLRSKEIEEIAKAAAEKVLTFGTIEALPPMSAYERRLVHVVLGEIKGVEGISEGEDPDRRIVIRAKKDKLT